MQLPTKHLIYCLCFLVWACSTKKESQNTTTTKDSTNRTEPNPSQNKPQPIQSTKPKSIKGYYTGVFEPTNFNHDKDVYHANKITISIDSLNQEQKLMYGHSIVAGNKRPFKGNYQITDSGYVAKVDEPGTNRYDGAFTFTIKPQGQILEGTWKAFRKDFSATETKYSLKPRKFVYQPEQNLPDNIKWTALYNHQLMRGYTRTGERLSEYVTKLNPSTTLLTKNDVENLYKGDLEVIRNSIYARHGYSFKNRKMRFVFDYIDWYMPISTDVRSELTNLEKKNIDLLKRYENHATRYYDTFGR